MTLKISKDLELPDDAALWTFADLGIKGSGKTYGADVMAEEMVSAGIPIIIIDGVGVHWGIRVGVNEKGEPDPDVPGLPCVVFGGEHKDLPIPSMLGRHRNLVVDEAKLQLMVKAILEAGISAVLDTSEFSKSMQRRIVGVFVNELYHLNSRYGTRHVFIEEADLYIPQKIVGDLAFCAGAIDDLIRRGGNFNLGATLISQRHAVVNKDVITQCGCLIILRTVHDLDKKAVRAWVENVARPKDPKILKWYDGLRGLKDGQAWVWHPTEPEIWKKIQFRKRRTLHATREYFRRPHAKQVTMRDVGQFVDKFKKVFEPPKPKVEALKPPAPQALPPIQAQTGFGPYRSHFPLPTASEPRLIPAPTTGGPLPVPMSVPEVRLPTSQGVTYGLPEPEPKSTLGRLILMLYKNTDNAGNRKWSLRAMLDALTNGGCPEDENTLKQDVQYLLQVQMLEPCMSGARTDYKFVGRDRVQIIPQQLRVELP